MGLDLAQSVLDGLDAVARDATDRVPAQLDRGELVARRGALRDLEDRLGLVEEGELGLEVGLLLLVVRGVDLGLGAVEHVARRLELRPERVVVALARAPGELPLVEEAAVRGDAADALRLERARLLDDGLLLRAGVLVRVVELGEERLALGVDGGARRAEALPELVGLVLREAGTRLLVLLPAAEQGVDLGGQLLPLDLREVLGRESLGLLDDGGALGDGALHHLALLLALLLGQLADGGGQDVETRAERGEVADGVGAGDGLDEVGDGLGDVGRGCAALGALLQERDLSREVGELALEVGQRLLGGPVGVLADGAFALALAQEDGARLVDAAPGGLIVVSHGCSPCS